VKATISKELLSEALLCGVLAGLIVLMSSGEAPEQSVAQPAVDYIRSRRPGFVPKVGVILGSGLGDLADKINDSIAISYSEIPGFPKSTVHGHKGQMVLGFLEGVPVACLQGRIHLYEGIEPAVLRTPIYSLRLLGCSTLILTSAVGSLRESWGPGTLVALSDHINMQAKNPLIGPSDPIGPRFPSMLNAYDPALRAHLRKLADQRGITLGEGVYVSTLGPCFETPAEIRAFKTLGGDVVGMSTVPEVILARHCGLRVLAVAVVVNLACGLTDEHITHEDTLKYSAQASGNMEVLLSDFFKSAGSVLDE